jgi:hypothetical protein
MTGGCVTLAASRLLGLDAAPAPRLATDKTTARPSAKRRRIQLPLNRGKSFSGRMLLWSNDLKMLPGRRGCVNQKSQCGNLLTGNLINGLSPSCMGHPSYVVESSRQQVFTIQLLQEAGGSAEFLQPAVDC